MGFFNFNKTIQLRVHAERVGIGLCQINNELRKHQSATPLIEGLCIAVSDEMQKMYTIADQLSTDDRFTISLSYNGKMILYNDLMREIEFIRNMLLID